jgi:ribulose-phosphate 3-epimerase
MKKIEIIPAILPQDFAELEEKVSLVKAGTKWIQLDVCDGQFTPRPSWPYRKTDDNFELIVREDQGLPGWENLEYEIDLMVNRPEEVVDDWVSAGATRVVIHAESKGNPMKAVEMLEGRVEVGLAFNIGSPQLGQLSDLLHSGFMFNYIQLMGIDKVGFQGQAFDEKVLEEIRDVKELADFYKFKIQIDGGVSLETAPKLIQAGADRLIVGSAVINAENPLGALEEFEALS